MTTSGIIGWGILAAGSAELVSPGRVALALGLSFLFGLAFEEVYARNVPNRPGGIRTFPILTLAGIALFALEPTYGIAFVAGLLVLGLWLSRYYRARLDVDGGPEGVGAEIVVPVLNLLAYALGPVALLLPAWFSVGVTVVAVLLLGAREALHTLARRLPAREITTLGKFLILTGIVLPLLPDEPVIPWTPITPYQVWLAVVVVCSLSYGSYLVQRFVSPRRGVLAAAVLGGLYSSTATTVVLSRRAREGSIARDDLNSGVVLATALMYLRLGVVVAVFDPPLALRLAPSLAALLVLGLLLSFACRRLLAGEAARGQTSEEPRNPLELGAAVLFAAMFVLISVASMWIEQHYGRPGLFGLAGVVGVTDIDPFVLSVAQGGVPSLGLSAMAAAILVAASSNDVLKGLYAGLFARRLAMPAVLSLLVLALAGGGLAVLLAVGG